MAPRKSRSSASQEGVESPAHQGLQQEEAVRAGDRRRKGSRARVDAAKEQIVEGTTAQPQASVNSIRPAPLRARREAPAPTQPAQREESNAHPARSNPTSLTKAHEAEQRMPDAHAVPVSVRDRFVQDGRHFYFPDGTRAFRDRGRRLTTESENAQVIQAMIDIARARWSGAIVVSGTETFRAEAWRQARLAGLEVRGYRASEAEQQQLVRALARRKHQSRSAEELRPEAQSSPEMRHAHREAAPARRNSEEAMPAQRARERPPLWGKLIDHGADHYGFDERQEKSYFVRIQTPSGRVHTIWGLDLERAVKQSLSNVRIGDEVGIKHIGEQPVTVTQREYDEAGNVRSEKRVPTHRNQWVIEKRSFFADREQAARTLRDERIAPEDAVRAHPALKGAYINLQLAQQLANRLTEEQDRREFLARIRHALAESVERGEPLPTARLKTHERVRRADREWTPAAVPSR